jgi:hypothetical protein
MSVKNILVAAVFAAAFAAPARAQNQHYDVENINFDLWCQETQHLPPARCDKRLPADEAAFEDYRSKVEKYEIPYLQGRENGAQLNRVILHGDPVDNPVTKNPAAQEQLPSSPSNLPRPGQ